MLKQTSKFTYLASCSFELLKGLIILAIVAVIAHFFFATIFIISGESMEPNFHDKQLILVEKIGYFTHAPKRGAVIGLRFLGDPEYRKYIKRIIGLPGETIEIKEGRVFINNSKLLEVYLPTELQTEPDMKKVLGDDEYFIMGDNRNNSSDSRVWGVLPQKEIIGRAWAVLWPFKDAEILPQPVF